MAVERMEKSMGKDKSIHELTPEERRADFHGKDLILQEHYAPIPPALFYSDFLFHDLDDTEFRPSIIMYEHTAIEGEHPWKRQTVPVDDLMDYAWRDDVAINPCGYWNNYPRKKLMRRVYAFVMDVDEVRPVTMEYLISLIEQEKFPRPTAISNSGSGVHFFTFWMWLCRWDTGRSICRISGLPIRFTLCCISA